MLFMGWGDGILIAQGVLAAIQTGIQITQAVIIKNLLDKITNGAWLLEQARRWGFYFDKILIEFSDKVYSYFNQIVGGTLLTPSVVDGLMNKLYIIVGIFIFFKLAMVAMKYMINPGQFLDDKLGAQTLVKRVILGSLIIILIPLIFSTASKLQTYIIEDRVIEKIILPKDAYNELTKTNNGGKKLAMTVFKGFFGWNEAVPKTSASKESNAYERVEKYNDVSSFQEDYMTKKVGEEYVISYVPIISTLAVGYLLFMLIKYAMEVAFRSFKLVFLQLISSFVIVNYMLDPSKEEVMKKWVNATVATYLMIFIRVITLWFATLIAFYLSNGIPTSSGEVSLLNTTDALLKALIVLGLFAFLKDLPKILSEIFGYNLQENETIGGIMNQGVGILKGFALGKIGMGFAKQQMGFNVASSITGGVSNSLGAVGSTMNKMKGQSKGSIFAASLGNGANGLGMGATGVVGTMGSTLSTSMGSTVLSPIAQAGSIAAGGDRVVRGDSSGYLGKSVEEVEEKRQEKKDSKSFQASQYNEFANNILNSNSNELKNFMDGDKINLENKVSSFVDNNNQPIVQQNPIVQNMSKEIYNQLPSKENVTLESVTSKVENAIQDKSLISNPQEASTLDIARVMDKVTNDIQSTLTPSLPITTKPTNTPFSTTDNQGFENITLQKPKE